MKKVDEFNPDPVNFPDPEKFSRKLVVKALWKGLIKELIILIIGGLSVTFLLVQLGKRYQIREATMETILAVLMIFSLLFSGYCFWKYIRAAMEEDDEDW